MNAHSTTLIPVTFLATGDAPHFPHLPQMEIEMRSTTSSTGTRNVAGAALVPGFAKGHHRDDPRARSLGVKRRRYDFRKGGFRR